MNTNSALRAIVAAAFVLGVGLSVARPGGLPIDALIFDAVTITSIGLFLLLFRQRANLVINPTTSLVTHLSFAASRSAPDVPIPGDDLDIHIDDPGYRERLPAYLREHLREVLINDHDLSPDTADEYIASGRWTEDPIAARYISGDEDVFSTWRQYLLQLGGVSPHERAFKRTARALHQLEDQNDVT